MKNTRLGKKLPPIPNIAVKQIMQRADYDSLLLTIESEHDDVGYITDKRDFVIVTKNGGLLRLPIKMMRDVLKEALETLEVIV